MKLKTKNKKKKRQKKKKKKKKRKERERKEKTNRKKRNLNNRRIVSVIWGNGLLKNFCVFYKFERCSYFSFRRPGINILLYTYIIVRDRSLELSKTYLTINVAKVFFLRYSTFSHQKYRIDQMDNQNLQK